MAFRIAAWGLLLMGVAAAAQPPSNSAEIVVNLQPAQARSQTRFGMREGGRSTNKGVLLVDGKSFALYVQTAAKYSTKNTGEDPTDFSNTSTPVFIDDNGDGQLSESERWFSSFPLRIGDRMFDVVRFGANGRSLVLRPSKTPLSGVILGRKCPPFSYVAEDGKRRTLADYAGKALLIDVWSHT